VADSATTLPAASAQAAMAQQPIQIFFGKDLRRAVTGEPSSSPDNRKRHRMSSSPVRTESDSEEIITVETLLGEMAENKLAQYINMDTLMWKFSAENFLDKPVEFLEALPSEELRMSFKLDVTETAFIYKALKNYKTRKYSEKKKKKKKARC